ncbi:MAG: BON domain-containing protein [Pirellulaceae bacterium]
MGGLMGGMVARGQFGAMNNLFNNQGMNQFGGEQQKRLPTRLRVSFSHPKVNASTANSSLRQRVELLSIPGVSVAVEGQVATVRGTVGSEDQRRMVARFVSLEPGVIQVDNQLQVREAQTP